MADFDPYYKWLGIKPKHQSPHYYRLLGLDPFESDPDVIDTASEQRMTFLQACSNGEHVELAQKLMNEISKARVVLLNDEQRQQYDTKLRKRLGEDDAGPEAPVVNIKTGKTQSKYGRQRKKSNLFPIMMGLSLVVIVAAAFKFFSSGDVENEGTAKTESQKSEAAKPETKVADSKTPDPPAEVAPKESEPNTSTGEPTEVTTTDPNTTPDTTNDGTQEPSTAAADIDLDEDQLGPEIDLLADVNITDDSHYGTWEVQDGQLVSTEPTGGRIRFDSKPTAEYNLRLIARRTTPEGGIALRLATPDVAFNAYLETVAPNKDRFYGLGRVGQLDPHRNATSKRRYKVLVDDAENVVDVVVRSDRIRVIVNGRLMIDFTGEQHVLSLSSHERQYSGDLQLIAVNSGLQVSQFTLRTKTTLPTLPKAPTRFTDATEEPAPELTRLPVPSEAELKAARLTLAKELDLNPRDQAAANVLWNELIGRGESETRTPAQRYEAFQLAAELAQKAGSMDWITQAAMRPTRAFEIEEWPARIQALRVASNVVSKPKEFLKQFKETVDEALAINEFEVASELAELLSTIARKSRDRALTAEAGAGRKLVIELRREHEEAKATADTLVQTPEDERANMTLGKYLCLRKGNWLLGLRFLARAGDSQLRDLALRDLARPQTAAEQMKLADDWMTYSKSPRAKNADWLAINTHYWLGRAKGLITATEAERETAAAIYKRMGTPVIVRSERLTSGTLPEIGFSIPIETPVKFASTDDRFGWRRGSVAQPGVLLTDGFATLLEVAGNFLGGGEWVRVLPHGDDQWKLDGRAAQFVGAVGSTIRVEQPGSFYARLLTVDWSRGRPRRRLIHSSQGFCFLSKVVGGLRGRSEHAWISLGDDGYWYVEGTNGTWFAVGVTCMQIPGFKAEYKLHTWTKGELPIRLIHKDDGFACLAGIGGGFHGGGESARIQLCDDGYWYVYGRSAQPSMTIHALTVRQLDGVGEAN